MATTALFIEILIVGLEAAIWVILAGLALAGWAAVSVETPSALNPLMAFSLLGLRESNCLRQKIRS